MEEKDDTQRPIITFGLTNIGCDQSQATFETLVSTPQMPIKADNSTPKTEPSAERGIPLTNRQLVLLMTSVLNLTLNPEFLNQKALARLLAAVSGKSEDSLRQTIMKMAKEGCETQGARQDMLVVASLLNDIDQDLAQRLRNDASE